MSGTSLELIYRDDTARIREVMQDIRRRGMQTRPLTLALGEYLVRSTEDRFNAQRDPDGLPWTPLAPATLIRKKLNKILTEKSRLRSSVVYRAGNDRIEWGTNLIYARIHQEGGEIERKPREQVIHFKRGKDGATRFAKANQRATYAMKAKVGAHTVTMPARPFLGISAEDGRELLARVNDYYREAVTG